MQPNPCFVTSHRVAYYSKPLFQIHFVLLTAHIQTRDQLGTPSGVKSFLRRVQIFKTMSNTFFQTWRKLLQGGRFPPCAYLVTALPIFDILCRTLQTKLLYAFWMQNSSFFNQRLRPIFDSAAAAHRALPKCPNGQPPLAGSQFVWRSIFSVTLLTKIKILRVLCEFKRWSEQKATNGLLCVVAGILVNALCGFHWSHLGWWDGKLGETSPSTTTVFSTGQWRIRQMLMCICHIEIYLVITIVPSQKEKCTWTAYLNRKQNWRWVLHWLQILCWKMGTGHSLSLRYHVLVTCISFLCVA